MLQPLGKFLIITGAILGGLGLILYFFPHFSHLPGLKYLGRLPGDIHIRKKNFQLFFPLTTSILLSLFLTLLLYFFSRR